MSTGFRNASGTDFDDVFDPYVQGTKPAATGYRTSDGVDLNQRFAPLAFGSAAAVQGYRISSGADVNTLWAAKGTASYLDPSPDYQWSTFRAFSGTSPQTVQSTLTWSPDGTWANTSPGTTTKSGTWAPSAGTPGNLYQMMIDNVVLTPAAGHTLTFSSNPAASWVDMSSAVSCVMQDVGAPSSNASDYSVRLRIRLKSTGAVMYTGTISGSITIANV